MAHAFAYPGIDYGLSAYVLFPAASVMPVTVVRLEV